MSQNAQIAGEVKKIFGGPNKMDLMLALFDSTLDSPRFVEFQVGNEKFKIHARTSITQVQREDGSGESWNFEGVMMVDTFNPPRRPIRGYYNTQSRTGTFSFV